MAKFIPDAILDNELNLFAAATALCICGTQPTTYTEAYTTYCLGKVTVAPADFSKADGDTSGRKLTLAAKSGITVDVSGTAAHYALVTVTGSVLLLVGTITSQVVTAGNTMDFPATDVNEVRDPS